MYRIYKEENKAFVYVDFATTPEQAREIMTSIDVPVKCVPELPIEEVTQATEQTGDNTPTGDSAPTGEGENQ